MKYAELIKALRICGKGRCVDCDRQRQDKCLKRYWNNEDLIDGMLCEAAAAIEELQAEVEELKAKKMKLAENSLRFVGKVRELDKRRLEPKRGEIVRCRECRWGHLCVMGQHLGLDGFCSKGEREVQG